MTPAERRAMRAGAGSYEGIDPEDEDMVDAALLAMPDSMGNAWWRPSRLTDIDEMPHRTLKLFLAYRAGLAQAADREARVEKTGTIGGKKVG